MTAPASPCSNVCEIDEQLPWCRGCGRSLAEIEQWPNASVAQKHEILARLPERLAQLARKLMGG